MSRSRSVVKGFFSASKSRIQIVMLAMVAMHLMAMCSAGSDWVIEMVDDTRDIHNGIDIEVNDPNLVHLYYDNMTPWSNIYATRSSGGWSYYDRNDFSAVDMEIDPSGRPRMITTFPGTSYTLEYWQKSDTYWYYASNIASNVSAGNAELEMHSSGMAMLGYLDRSAQSLVYGEITGDLWDSAAYVPRTIHNSSVFDTAQPLIKMVLDHDEQPCFLWYETANQQLKWARRDTGGIWSVDTIRNGLIMGYDAVFDSNNNLHLAYIGTSSPTFDVRHGVYNGSSWQDKCVDVSGNQIGSIVIDSQDQPHLAYIDYEASSDHVKYATYYGNQWHSETVMELADNGTGGLEEVVMDVDSEDHLHMAFRGDADELRYARLDDVPRYDICTVSPSLDAQATYSSSVGFIISDGAYGIDVDKIPSSGTDRRGILEFNCDSIHPGVEIISAKLQLDVSAIVTSGDEGPTPSVYAFAGDGQILPSDATKTQTLVGISEPILDGVRHFIDLDPSVIETLCRQNSHLGLLLVGTTYGMSFYTLEWPYSSFAEEAMLILEVTAEPIPGDANKDNVVDEQDASIMASNWFIPNVGWSGGDFNGDGIVNAADASIMAANWGQTAESQTTVPEPAMVVFLVTVLGWGLVSRRRRCFEV